MLAYSHKLPTIRILTMNSCKIDAFYIFVITKKMNVMKFEGVKTLPLPHRFRINANSFRLDLAVKDLKKKNLKILRTFWIYKFMIHSVDIKSKLKNY